MNVELANADIINEIQEPCSYPLLYAICAV